MSDWNTQVIAEFRANGGKVAQFGDAPLVILNTIGAKSGEIREVPLVALLDGGRMVVFASAAGSPKHPDWLFNLRANPEITVEYQSEKFVAKVSELPTGEGAAKLEAQGAIMPQFLDYITKAAPRVIPAFAIERI
jgi:deazaflavin-dependent oxidoreductase (nitroreductase family)